MERLEEDRRSRILVIPATGQSRDAGVRQAERIIELIIANDKDSADLSPASTLSSSSSYPWHIANRYYEADVHFKIADEEVSLHIQGREKKLKSGHRWTARQVHVRSDGEDGAQLDADGNDDQIRDIFAALELGKAPVSAPRTEDGSAKLQQQQQLNSFVREQLANVQAVLILVNREQGLAEHRRILATLNAEGTDDAMQRALFSGFDLAISLVVALPAPLRSDAAPSSLDTIAFEDKVEEMYAEEGWEYVDLAKVDRFAVEGIDGTSGNRSESDDEEEKQGIERIREALMTHTWPALKRKQDRFVRRRTDDDDDHKNQFTALRLDLEALDEAGLAHPTEKDEELARAFLARIEASQLARADADELIQEQSLPPQRTNTDLNVALERFLEDEDSQWPAMAPATKKDMNDEAWPRGDSENADKGGAFDDDFSDFVGTNSLAPIDFPSAKDDTFDDEGELDFIGDSDDAMLMRALEQHREAKGTEDRSDTLQLNFESTLQAVLAHAERVRALPNHEQRREEAARVALGLLDQ